MGALVFASACVGPLTLVCGFVVVALMLFGGGSSLAAVVMCTVVVASAPLVAGCFASTLYRWCLPSASGRLVMNAAGLLTVLALLSDGQVLSDLARASSAPLSVTSIGKTLSVASFVGILSASVVMLAVLILEVPTRWFMGREDSTQWEGILCALRLIATVAVLVVGWGMIDEFARARLREFLVMFS